MKVGLASLAGVVLFAWPFLGGWVPADAPALALAIAAVAGLVLVELGTRALDARRLALLAVLAAIDTGLRLAVVQGIGGFSPIFFLVLCAGWVFGPSYGFLVGAFSILVSAMASGGIGPWLPYQVFAVGWVGVAAGLAGLSRSSHPRRLTQIDPAAAGVRGQHEDTKSTKTHEDAPKRERGMGDFVRSFGFQQEAPGRARRAGLGRWGSLVVLAAVGALSGWAFGALMDIQVWVTGYRGVPTLGWQPGLGPGPELVHFARFYLATSLAYDTFRSVGNALMVLLLGTPVLAALARVRARLSFEVVSGHG